MHTNCMETNCPMYAHKTWKLPSLAKSYQSISLLSAIKGIAFVSEYQSGLRKAKSTNDHLLCQSQTVMESFNRGELVITSFLDVEKAFHLWHNGIFKLGLPTKMMAFWLRWKWTVSYYPNLPESRCPSRFSAQSINVSGLRQWHAWSKTPLKLLSPSLKMTLVYGIEVKRETLVAHRPQKDLDTLVKWFTK